MALSLVSKGFSSFFHQNQLFCVPVRFAMNQLNRFDLATGLEKKDSIGKPSGNDSPFDMKVFRRGVGTKDNPNLIPSAFEARIVGCICEEDQSYVQWMWLQKGKPRRCECGYWFKLVEKSPV